VQERNIPGSGDELVRYLGRDERENTLARKYTYVYLRIAFSFFVPLSFFFFPFIRSAESRGPGQLAD
jgi:Na+-driven multidrug efflux pump